MEKNRFVSKIAASVLLIGVCGSLSIAFPADMHYGIKGGLSWAELRNAGNITNALSAANQNPDPETFFWWTGSFYCSSDLIPRYFAVQMEAEYTRLGKSWDLGGETPTGGGAESHFQLRTDYAQFPLLMKFMAPVSKYAIPNMYVGPCLSVAFRSRARDMTGLPGSIQNSAFFSHINIRDADWDYARNDFDLGFVAGFGAQFPAGPGSIDIDLRYNFGGLNVFNFGDGEGIRNYSFMVMVGYSL